jgi:hypothetical protein
MTQAVTGADVHATAGGGPARRSHAVVLWAMIGLVWVVVCARAVAGWVGSSDFGAAPILTQDAMPTGAMVMLRIVEVLSVAVLLASIWFLTIKPWRERREVRIETLMIIGGVFGFVADSFLNVYSYLFAFNSHSVNLGTWVRWLPFRHADAPHTYGEALLWGLPMYVYFCSALAAMGIALRNRWVAKHPETSDTLVLVGMWVGFFVFDFVVENAIIRTSQAYSFVRTTGSLTLWPGSQDQFPIYESICVAFVAMGFAAVRLSADRSPDGVSFLERGLTDLPRRIRFPVRLLAAIGYCAIVLIMLYHLPVNWLGITGDSVAHLPSYLQAR